MQRDGTSAKDGQTIGDLIHDLRTPLTGIMGFTELLIEDPTIVGQNREYVEIILNEAKKLEQMLSDQAKALDS
jgi:signal transduction histidine kinase